MPRLNQQRQQHLEPLRVAKAIEEVQKLGFAIIAQSSTSISFEFKGSIITYYPYSGWATGKTIKDGRGLNNLLKQLRK